MSNVVPLRKPPIPMAARPGSIVEMIRLRVIGPDVGFADVRLTDVHLRNLRVRRGLDGKLTITPPRILSRNGEHDYGLAFAIQPAALPAIERAIRDIWSRIGVDAGAGNGEG